MAENELKQFLEYFKVEVSELIEQKLSMPEKQEKQLLTLNEAAKYLGISYNTLQKFRYAGLKFFEVDGVKRVYKKDLEIFIEKHSY